MNNYYFPLFNSARVVVFAILLFLWNFFLVSYYGINSFAVGSLLPKFFNYFSVSFIVFIMSCVILIVSEGVFSKTETPYVLLRKRIDQPGAHWEEFEMMILEYDEDMYSDFFEYQNTFFSSDGFFPRSFSEIGEVINDTFRMRVETLSDIDEFLIFVFPRMESNLRELILTHTPATTEPFFSLEFKSFDGFALNTTRPTYTTHTFSYDMDNDYSDLGISIVSGSAHDASTYIFDMEQPTFFTPEALKEYSEFEPSPDDLLMEEQRKYSTFGLKDLSSISVYIIEPEPITYDMKFEHMAEYPVNVDLFYVKRDWEENPDSLTWRDPITNVYSNLTRLRMCNFNLYINDINLLFLLYNKPPREPSVDLKSYRVPFDNKSSYNYLNLSSIIKNIGLVTQTHKVISPEIVRLGRYAALFSILAKGLIYYITLDRDRSHKVYSNFPAELEFLPIYPIFFCTTIGLKVLTLKQRFSLLLDAAEGKYLAERPLSLKEISEYNKNQKKSGLLIRVLIKTISNNSIVLSRDSIKSKDVSSELIEELHLFHLNFRINLFLNHQRQTILLRSLLLGSAHFITPFFNHSLVHSGTYDVSDKIGQDAALSHLPFWFEEDRFYADFEDIAAISAFNNQFDINTLDTFKSFHFCEYEYLIEEDDYFEQSEGESQVAPAMPLLWIVVWFAYFKEPLNMFLIVLGLLGFWFILTELYESFGYNPAFSYFNSSSIGTTRDNTEGYFESLIYPRQDYIPGYITEISPVLESSLLIYDDESYFYHDGVSGGSIVTAECDAYGTELDFFGEDCYIEDIEDDEQIPEDDGGFDGLSSQRYNEIEAVVVEMPNFKRWKFTTFFTWWYNFERDGYDTAERELYMGYIELANGLLPEEGETFGYLEYLEDAGTIDEGTGDDYLHDHYAIYSGNLCFPLELPFLSKYTFMLYVWCLAYSEEGECDYNDMGGIGSEPPEESIGDEAEEEDDDIEDEWGVEDYHAEECLDYEDNEYDHGVDIEETHNGMRGDDEDSIYWEYPDQVFLSSESTILRSFLSLFRFLFHFLRNHR